MRRFWALFADALTYVVFLLPAALVLFGVPLPQSRRFGLDSLNHFLDSAGGRIFAFFVAAAIGLLFARYVQLGFRSLGSSDEPAAKTQKRKK
jgi:hypothetical protein